MTPSNRPAVLSGDVTVHPTANIGSGVLLHANPGSQLIIGVGACIGAGCILHAHTGTLFIGDGVILGMGTLVFGTTQVGERSCVGADSSLIDVSIAPNTVLPPNSLIDSYSSSPEYKKAHPEDMPGFQEVVNAGPEVKQKVQLIPEPIEVPKQSEPPPPEPINSVTPMALTISSPIYGRAGLERLLATLRNQR
jgi:carbon dioxide concentrating mechanism protein CcmN